MSVDSLVDLRNQSTKNMPQASQKPIGGKTLTGAGMAGSKIR